MRIKHIIIVLSFILFSGIFSFAQDVSQLDWLSDLDGKSVATYGDAVRLFALQEGKKSAVALTGTGIELEDYSQGDSLTKGMLAKMTARYLDLGGSLKYMIFGTERYAYRACIAYGIMRAAGSENDLISGPELVEVMGKISEMKGGK
jgi:hypothetical protein